MTDRGPWWHGPDVARHDAGDGQLDMARTDTTITAIENETPRWIVIAGEHADDAVVIAPFGCLHVNGNQPTSLCYRTWQRHGLIRVRMSADSEIPSQPPPSKVEPASGWRRVARAIASAALFLTLALIVLGWLALALFAGDFTTARVTVILVNIFAAVLPALLFLQFQRQRLATVATEFYRDATRLDLGIVTVSEAESRFGDLVTDRYGCNGVTERRITFRRGLPILGMTLLLVIGWTMVLQPFDMPAGATQLTDYLRASRAPLAFAFLGSYFFTLHALVRRYLQSDLAPRMYTALLVRTMCCLLLVGVVQAGVPWIQPVIVPVAFLIGVFPESGLTLLQEAYRRASGTDGPAGTRARLRAYGIRTASDLLEVLRIADERGEQCGGIGGIPPADDGNRAGVQLQVLADSLADDEWIAEIQHWRSQRRGQLKPARSPEDLLPPCRRA